MRDPEAGFCREDQGGRDGRIVETEARGSMREAEPGHGHLIEIGTSYRERAR